MRKKSSVFICAMALVMLSGCAVNETRKDNSSSSSSSSSSLPADSIAGDNSSDTGNSGNDSSSSVSSSKNESSSSSLVSSSSVSSSSSSEQSSSSSSSSSKPASSSSSKVQSSSKPVVSSSKPVASSKPAEKKWTEKEYLFPVEFIITTNGVNARSKPFADSTSIKVYNKDEKVTCVAETDNGYIKLEKGGYVNKNYLKSEPDPVEPNSKPNNGNTENPYNPDGTLNRDYYFNHLIKTNRPVPNDVSNDVLDFLHSGRYYEQKTKEQVIRESWDLNVGDTTFQGYKIIGKTPEGFGYIEVDEYSHISGQYVAGYKDNGREIYVYDFKARDEYWKNHITIT